MVTRTRTRVTHRADSLIIFESIPLKARRTERKLKSLARQRRIVVQDYKYSGMPDLERA
jgi:hypothetical protein